MKPKFLLLPAIALLIAIGWIQSGRAEISKLERESNLLKQSLAERFAGQDGSSALAQSRDPLGDKKKPLNWKKIALMMPTRLGGIDTSDVRAMLRLGRRLQAMSKEELAASMGELAALDLPSEKRYQLEHKLLSALCEKDPEFAVTRFISLGNPDRISGTKSLVCWALSDAFKKWALKDPIKAAMWFDQQIAAGVFDSKTLDQKSDTRNGFEGKLISALIATDPAAAAARLAVLPVAQRGEVLSVPDQGADDLALATLVRTQLPEAEQREILSQYASSIVTNKGYAKVTEYLDRIAAAPAERAACAAQAAKSCISITGWNGKLTRGEFEAMRDWVFTQAPDTLDRVTGSSLAYSTRCGKNGLEFSAASALAAEYFTASGNNDVLVEFLSASNTAGHTEEARKLAEQITDPARRTAVLDKLKRNSHDR